MARAPISVRVVLRAEDVRAGLLRTVLGQTRLARLFPIWVMLTAGMAAYALVQGVSGAGLPPELYVFAGVLVGTLALGLFAIGALGDRMFAGLPSAEATWRLSTTGVELESGAARTLHPWKELTYERRRDRVLLHPTPTAFVVLPLGSLTPGERSAVLDWLETHARPVPVPKRPWIAPVAALVLGVLTALALRALLR